MTAPRTAKTSLLDDLSRAPGDEATRMVYADALDITGDAIRATYVRTGDGGRDLIAASDLAWRRTVSLAPIRYCDREGSDCPRRWNALELTGVADVRRCAACAREVAYCETLDAVQAAARRRQLLAFDAALRSADADARYQYARRMLGHETTRVSELPLFVGPIIPRHAGELDAALGIRIPSDQARPPRIHRTVPHPSGLIHFVHLHLHQAGPEGGRPHVLHCYRVMFDSDREAAEARLRERYGEATAVDDRANMRGYGRFRVADEVDGHWSVAWISDTAAPPPSRPSELPLIVGPIIPARVAELETALHIRLADATLAALAERRVAVRVSDQIPSLSIVARAGPGAAGRALLLDHYAVELGSDRAACEARLRARFGLRVEVLRERDRLCMYGPFFVTERAGDAGSLEWFASRPSWAYAITPSLRAGFVARLVDAIGRVATLDELWQVRPPNGAGCSSGWTDHGEILIVFRPGIPAIELARAFGWTEVVVGPVEPGGPVLHTVSGDSVLAARHGAWEVVPRLDGAPRGVRFRGLEVLRRPAAVDLVRLVVVRAPRDAAT